MCRMQRAVRRRRRIKNDMLLWKLQLFSFFFRPASALVPLLFSDQSLASLRNPAVSSQCVAS